MCLFNIIQVSSDVFVLNNDDQIKHFWASILRLHPQTIQMMLEYPNTTTLAKLI